DGPSNDTNSPGRTLRSRRSSATTPFAKVLPTLWSATTGAPDLEGSTGTLHCSLCGATDDRSLFPQSDLGHERDPTLYFGGVEFGKRLDAEPGGLEADGAEFLPDVLLFDDLGDGRAEHGARILRHLRMPIDADPAVRPDAGTPCFLEGGPWRDARRTLRPPHGGPFDQPGLICSITTGNTSMSRSMEPPMRSLSAAGPPRYGTCTNLVPVSFMNNSTAR